MEVALADINLKLIHVLGKHNVVADSLSRYYINDQHKTKVEQLLPQVPGLFLLIVLSLMVMMYNILYRISCKD